MAWNETANYLIFDQPLGVGLSFAPDDQLPANLQQGVDQWYAALAKAGAGTGGTGTDVQLLGYIQEGGGLSWVKVLNAGHLAVLDQPLLIDLIQAKLLAP